MRSLFVKIFLWFWLATILVVGVLVLTTIRTPGAPRREHIETLLDNLISVYGQRIVQILDRESPASLRQDLDELDHMTGVHFFIFADTGQEILDQPLSAGMAELVARARASGRTELAESSSRVPLVARLFATRKGAPYVVVAQMPPGPLSQLLASPYALALRLAAVVAMAGIVCYGLARYLTAPLRKLRASTRQLAQGDLAVRVGATVGHRRDEIGELGRDFDFMAEQIELLVSSQRRLLRDMSHELRSPLARLNVALGLARQKTGPEAGAVLDRIEREAQRLNHLIGELLRLARLEGSSGPITETEIDLADLVREVVADAEFEAQNCNRQVRLLRCDECTVTGMSELLRSAIENVIRNSLRHTAEGTQIDITLSCEQSHGESVAVIHIRDHGPGVPEAAVEDIFRPFYRVGDDRGRQTGGVGLGLAIARQAVRLHGGMISAANAPEGGLVVEIKLPTAPAGAA